MLILKRAWLSMKKNVDLEKLIKLIGVTKDDIKKVISQSGAKNEDKR